MGDCLFWIEAFRNRFVLRLRHPCVTVYRTQIVNNVGFSSVDPDGPLLVSLRYQCPAKLPSVAY